MVPDGCGPPRTNVPGIHAREHHWLRNLDLDADTNVEKSNEILSSTCRRFVIPHATGALRKQRIPSGKNGRQGVARGRIKPRTDAQWRCVTVKRCVQQINLRQNDDQHDHGKGPEQDDPFRGADALCVHAIQKLLRVPIPVNFVAIEMCQFCGSEKCKSNWYRPAYLVNRTEFCILF